MRLVEALADGKHSDKCATKNWDPVCNCWRARAMMDLSMGRLSDGDDGDEED
jgi:hypothetical protein